MPLVVRYGKRNRPFCYLPRHLPLSQNGTTYEVLCGSFISSYVAGSTSILHVFGMFKGAKNPLGSEPRIMICHR